MAAGADLLLKGAYTQSRIRQMIFGGAHPAHHHGVADPGPHGAVSTRHTAQVKFAGAAEPPRHPAPFVRQHLTSRERSHAGQEARAAIPASRNEGEGNKTAAREYNEAQRRFVESGKVDEKAREAEKALDTDKQRTGTRRGDRQAPLAWRGPGAEAQVAISPARREPGFPGSGAPERGHADRRVLLIGRSRALLSIIRASLATPGTAWSAVHIARELNAASGGASPVEHGHCGAGTADSAFEPGRSGAARTCRSTAGGTASDPDCF